MPSLRRPAPLYIPHESIHLSQVLGKLPPCLHHFDLNHLQHLPLPEHVLLPIRFRPKKISGTTWGESSVRCGVLSTHPIWSWPTNVSGLQSGKLSGFNAVASLLHSFDWSLHNVNVSRHLTLPMLLQSQVVGRILCSWLQSLEALKHFYARLGEYTFKSKFYRESMCPQCHDWQGQPT